MSDSTGATPFPLGVFVGNPNYFDSNEEASFEASFNAFSTLMKTKPLFLDQYGDERLPISDWVGQSSWNAASMAQSPVLDGVTPVIGLPMSSTASGSGTPDQFYKNFAAGAYDSVLTNMVKAWADNGFTTQIWRPGWEMNIDTMPSYAGDDAATRADWVAAFQHIYTVLHAAGAATGVNIQVAWNPSVTNYSHAGDVIETAYPGNQYVDIIAADVYGDVFPYGSPTRLYDWDKSGQVLDSSKPVYDTSVQQWASDPVNLQHYYTYPASNQWSLDGSDDHATTLQHLIDLAKSAGKPFAIAETGAGNTHDGAGLTDNPTFVKWLSDTLVQSGVKVSFVNIWDSNSGGSYGFTSSTDDKPLEAAAWAKYFGDPPVSESAATLASSSSDSQAADGNSANVNQAAPAEVAAAHSTAAVETTARDSFHFNFAPAAVNPTTLTHMDGIPDSGPALQAHADANSVSMGSFAADGDATHGNLAALANDARMAAGHDAALHHSVDATPASAHDAGLHSGSFFTF